MLEVIPIAAALALAGPNGDPAVPLPRPVNRLVSDQAALDVPVGVYADCSGRAELTHDGAAIDTCIGGLEYFIGHNPGPFTPTLNLAPGSELTWFDSSGTAHSYRIVSERTWNRFWGPPPPAQPDVAAQLQTCVTLDAVWDRILDAVPD